MTVPLWILSIGILVVLGSIFTAITEARKKPGNYVNNPHLNRYVLYIYIDEDGKEHPLWILLKTLPQGAEHKSGNIFIGKIKPPGSD